MHKIILLSLIPGLLLLAGCAPSIALYSPAAYERAVDLKVESLALLAHADAPYADYEADVTALCLEIAKAREYAGGLPKNEITALQWEILMDPEEELLGAFFARWQRGVALSLTYQEEKRRQIAAAFDTIIGLESHKLKPAALRQKGE